MYRISSQRRPRVVAVHDKKAVQAIQFCDGEQGHPDPPLPLENPLDNPGGAESKAALLAKYCT